MAKTLPGPGPDGKGALPPELGSDLRSELGSDLAANLRGVPAGNASPMTGSGTTTWILGQTELAVIDPGPDDPAHLAAILAAVPPGGRITAILVTHPHLDHSALVPALVQATGAPTYGYGAAGSGRTPLMRRLAEAGLQGGGEGVDSRFIPDHPLRDGDAVEGAGWRLEALHTPGHMGEHLAFAWGDLLFSGDHVMGWAPSLVSPPEGDMGAYMASLARLAAGEWRLFLPTHGPAIADPQARLAELAAHRRAREAQILAAVRAGARTLEAITAQAYAGTEARLLPAACRNALAHLIDLWQKSQIQADPLPLPDACFTLA